MHSLAKKRMDLASNLKSGQYEDLMKLSVLTRHCWHRDLLVILFENAPSSAPNKLRLACIFVLAALFPLTGWQSAFAADGIATGLPHNVPFADHLHRHFSSSDGLPSDWIYDLIQTRDGYLWIATHNGVARYDGLRFQLINRSSAPQLPANDTRVLYESRDGSVWIGTVGGLTRYRPGRPGRFERIDAFDGNSVHAIFEDSEGKLWIGTREETWIKKPGKDFEVASIAPSLVHAICEDSKGSFWFGSTTGLYRLDETEVVAVDPPRLESLAAGGKTTPTITALLADSSGVWVGASHGLIRVEPDGFPSNREDVGQTRINDLYRTRDGTVYAATSNGLFRLDESGFVSLDTESRARCMVEDREGGLWVGHVIDRGLHYFRRNAVETFLADHRVNCLHVDREGDFWFGTFAGLHHLRDDKLTSYGAAEGLTNVIVQSIAQGDDDTLWIGTREGLVRWNGTKLTPVVEPPLLRQLNVAAVFVDSRGTVWLTPGSGGALRFKDGAIESLPELDHGLVTWFHEDPDGKLWIGHEYGLYQFSAGQTIEVTNRCFERLNSRHFTCHYAAQDGSLWIGSSGGIVRYRDGQFDAVTSEVGLAADYIDCIQEDAHGNFWFAGRDGIFSVKSSQLNAAASGELERLTCHRLQPVAGVPVTNHAPKSHLTSNGEMWMVAKQGLIRVSPEPPEKPVSPEIRIEQVRVNGQTIAAENTVEFPSGRHRLAIDFSIPSFRNSHDLHVKYRLDGSDSDWILAGDERVAYYTDLAPGDYRFQVIAASGETWNREGADLDLSVQPRWWERAEVRVLAVVGILGLALLYARYRTRRYRLANIVLRRQIEDRKRAEEQSRRHQHELARVARASSLGEMATSIAHEIRQPLFAMMTDAKTATRLMRNDPSDINEIEDALQGIESAGNRASEIVDRIRSLVSKEERLNRVLDLSQVTRDAVAFLEPELRRRDVVLITDLSEDLPSISGDEIQLQQVLVNLIINGAQAMESCQGPRSLHVATWAEDGSVGLSVRDFGVGIDETQANRLFEPFYTTKARGIGMGLAINRTIIRAHGGQIWATANDGPGATFQFLLPIHEFVDDGVLADAE